MATHWMIYGANGYTGHLLAAEAKRQGSDAHPGRAQPGRGSRPGQPARAGMPGV